MLSHPLSEIKELFYSELSDKRTGASHNCVYLTDERYQQLVSDVTRAKVASKKERRDYWLLKKFDVMVVQRKAKLILPLMEAGSAVKFYVADNELFDILHQTHVAIGHGRRDRMMKELASRYKNITRRDVELFIQLCESCQKNKRAVKKRVPAVVKTSSTGFEFNSRCQVDFVDFQYNPDGDYKFMLVYRDHFTKFVILKALKSKTAEEVAHNLVDIFTLIGAPSILECDNGRAFSNKVLSIVKKYWPNLRIMQGRRRHDQGQDSVERTNQDIENMLTSWMHNENCAKWTDGIRFVQMMMNGTYHSAVKSCPYEALFGCKMKVGTSNQLGLQDVLNNTDHEESEVGLITTTQPSTSQQGTSLGYVCCVCCKPTNGVQQCQDCDRHINGICGHLFHEEGGGGNCSHVLCPPTKC